MAIPLGYPSLPREKVSLRSPLSDGGKASSGTELPIQEATTEGRFLSWVLIDRAPGYQRSSLPQGISTGSLASRYHQYSSKYSAGTCPTKGRQGVCLLPPFPFGGDSNIFERLAEKMLCPQGAAPPRKDTCRSAAGVLGVFRGHPPWQSPWGTQVRLGKRSRSARPCPTGATPHQARDYLSRRQPPKVDRCRGSSLTTHKASRGIPGFFFPPAGSLACGYHQYSSEYNAGTCPNKRAVGRNSIRPNYHCQNCRFLVH